MEVSMKHKSQMNLSALICIVSFLLLSPIFVISAERTETSSATELTSCDGTPIGTDESVTTEPRVNRVSKVPLYRYWNAGIGDHFYTTNWNELGSGNNQWAYEGVEGYIYDGGVTGALPLYRYWNPVTGDHFYTTNWGELGSGGSNGWRFEGVQGYVLGSSASGTTPLYRYWNPTKTDHFYTTDWSELGSGAQGYTYEGVQCYIFTSAKSDE
jgi:hypothetical protein